MDNDLISRSQACEMLLKQQQLTPSVVRRVLLQVPTQEAEKNEPLTLDELRKMGGEPVWLVNQNGGRWVIMSGVYLWDNRKNAEYGKTWLAYRRKPKGERKGDVRDG